MTRVYLDHASTSPLRPAAAAAMSAWLERSVRGEVGDPSRTHAEGLESRAALEQARAEVAALFGARPREVVFCSGATEAISMAASGVAERGRHTVLGAVEHSAVRGWADRGDCTVVGVDSHGRIGVDDLLAAVTPETAIVHLQWANHEVGTVQPILAAAAACRERGVLLHVDAAQAAGRVPIEFAASGIDLMSVSGHKFGAPTGTGALLIRRGLRIDPLSPGGDQERGRRAGMEHLAGIMGLAAAATELRSTLRDEESRCRRLSERLIAWVDATEGLDLLGSHSDRAPHLVCLQVAGVEPQAVLLGLDRAGIAVHSGNSCSSESLEPSPVLAAMGADAARSLRVSFGWNSTEADLDQLIAALPTVIDALRALRT